MNIQIEPRFRGPEHSGNGGYSCGILAQQIKGPAQVRLFLPPPLNTELNIAQQDDLWQMTHQGELIASAHAHHLSNDEIPAAPSLEQARKARETYTGHTDHASPYCFVCGPAREPGDGLCLFTGPVKNSTMVACDWQPDENLLNDDGTIKTEFVWSALDCPGFFALHERLTADNLFLLGQMAADILRPLPGDQPLVVYAWKSHTDGRKHFAGSAISTIDGEVLAHSEQVWIKLKNN